MATRQQIQAQEREVNPDALNALLGRAVQDMGAAMQAPLILIGDKLGLYRAMGDGVPVTPAELAKKTGTAERYVREWLNANAAGQLVQYDAAKGKFFMTPEQALVLALDDSPVHLPGFYHMLASVMKDEEKLTEIYRTGKGMGWHEHEKGLFEGCERFFRPTYLANLISSLDSGAGGCGGEAEGGCSRGGYWVRAWRVDAADGEGVSEVEVFWV